MNCKICSTPLGRESTQCVACERYVCERCENLLSDAITEIDNAFYCCSCASEPAIHDLRQYLRSGEHSAQSRDGSEKRWFGVRRCVAEDGAIHGWLVAGNGNVYACSDPLAVEAAIREMF
jgi:hypothetical protein